MRNSLIRTALGLLIFTANPLTAKEITPAVDDLQEYTAVYALRRGSLKAGEATFTLQRNDDGSYQYQSVTQATGFVALFRKDVIKESVRLEVAGNFLRPMSYEYIHENTDKNRNQSISFNWDAMIAESNNRGTESSHELHRFTVDRASMPLVIGYALAYQSLPKKYLLLDHGKVRNYRMVEKTGKEIKTKAGKFKTVLVQRKINSNDQKLRVWLSPEDKFLPIRIENEEPGGETTSLQLLSIHYEQTDDATP